MIGFDLLRPHLGWLFLLQLAVIVVAFLGMAWRRRELAALVAPERIARLVPGHSRTRSWARIFFFTAAALLLAVTALGPVRGYALREAVQRGVDLVVCIDTSQSMLARDLRPSRLERAKREVRGMLDRLRGDRVALIAFAGDAHEVAPLTHDRRTLASLLDYVSPEDNRLGGTDLAAALAAAIGMFDGRSGAHEAVVLLTDGEDLEGRAAEKAEEARARGIRVYVVGVGTAAGSKIPMTLPDGRQAFLRGPDGQEVVSRLEGHTLSELARVTGGDYLSAEQAATPLEELYVKRISELEGRELQSGKRRIPHDRYQWFLALAVGCMLAEAGLRERSGRARRREP